jgi:hypothetical protein
LKNRKRELHTGFENAQPEIHHAGVTSPKKKNRNVRWLAGFARRYDSSSRKESLMTKSGLLAATAILASALASPAMAQTMVQSPGHCAQFDANGNCLNNGAGRAYRHHGRWHESYNRLNGDRTGFWPADAAADVVGGAVGTAAAIATAPIGGAEYARRNGFVCTPGTWFRGEDGRRHLCQ